MFTLLCCLGFVLFSTSNMIMFLLQTETLPAHIKTLLNVSTVPQVLLSAKASVYDVREALPSWRDGRAGNPLRQGAVVSIDFSGKVW